MTGTYISVRRARVNQVESSATYSSLPGQIAGQLLEVTGVSDTEISDTVIKRLKLTWFLYNLNILGHNFLQMIYLISEQITIPYYTFQMIELIITLNKQYSHENTNTSTHPISYWRQHASRKSVTGLNSAWIARPPNHRLLRSTTAFSASSSYLNCMYWKRKDIIIFLLVTCYFIITVRIKGNKEEKEDKKDLLLIKDLK